MSYLYRCIVIPATYQSLAKEVFASIGGEGYEGMFVTGLSEDGEPPATHFISVGLVDSEVADFLPFVEGSTGILHSGNIQSLLASTEQLASSSKILTFLVSSDITDNPAQQVLERLSLNLIKP